MAAQSIDWDWISRHSDDIRTATVQHVELVLIAVGISVAIWVPIGVLLRNRRFGFSGATTAAGLVYTIPSLALFAFLVPTTGIGRNTVLIGLVLYSPLILMRNTVVGLQSVPGPGARGGARDGFHAAAVAAEGGGAARPAVDLHRHPHRHGHDRRASPRSASWSGADGLGTLIYTDGLNRDFLTPIVVGGVMATLLAVVLDLLLLGVERLLTPWARARAARS